MSEGDALARAQRVKALRLHLGLTQDQVADAGGFARTKMPKYESGKPTKDGGNRASSRESHEELASGFRLTSKRAADNMSLYLDGLLNIEELLAAERPVPFRDVYEWASHNPAFLECMKEHDDVTYDDAVLVRTHPPRFGEAPAARFKDDMYGHIKQLRAGQLGKTVAARPHPARALERKIDRSYDEKDRQ